MLTTRLWSLPESFLAAGWLVGFDWLVVMMIMIIRLKIGKRLIRSSMVMMKEMLAVMMVGMMITMMTLKTGERLIWSSELNTLDA